MRRTSANITLALLIAVAASGCESAKRLAPPGLFVYEGARVDREPNPYIEQRIEEMEAQPKQPFPRLGEQPTGAAQGLSPAEQARMEENLAITRERTQDAAAADRAAAEADRAEMEALETPETLPPDPDAGN